MEDPSTVEILLVEDNPHDAELTIRVLKKRGLANQLFRVEDGAEALDFVFCRGVYAQRQAHPAPKVILLDLKLPKVSGLEVLEMIKGNAQTRPIVVVILTSSAEDQDIATAYALGANSYIVKPVNFSTFLETITNVGSYWLQVNHQPQV